MTEIGFFTRAVFFYMGCLVGCLVGVAVMALLRMADGPERQGPEEEAWNNRP